MCLSNVEMRKELVKRVLELIKADPSAPCSCADCLALDEKLGGQTGTLLWFANNAAYEIRKVYPKIMVETLAYQWSINLPTIPTRTRDNVSIRVTCAGLSTKDWSDVQEAQFMPGSVCSAVEDSDASNGVAIKLPAGPNDWSLQASVFSRNCIKPASGLYISVKLDAIQASGPVLLSKSTIWLQVNMH